MIRAFCPGHITCFFSPAGGTRGNILERGSVGAGIRTSLGAYVEISERSDSKVEITIDGKASDAPVTRWVLSNMAPGRGLEVTVEGELPNGEGFGMSASGAIATALGISEMLGLSEEDAFEVAHKADIMGGGGLGDVSALTCPVHQPVRIKEGLPPLGRVVGTDVKFDCLTLVVLGPKMHTGNVLSDPVRSTTISRAGVTALSDYVKKPAIDRLFGISNRFSEEIGLESRGVADAIADLRAEGYGAGMCMLGNSIFTDAPKDVVIECLGLSEGIYECASTDMPPHIIHKG